MSLPVEILAALAVFGVVALASQRIGRLFARFHLPLITGFLFAGVLAGPYLLDLVGREHLERLRFIDEVALGFIAFAAGSELYLRDIRGRLRSIRWTTFGQVVFTFVLTAVAVYLAADQVPFIAAMPPAGRLAVGLLAGAVLIARSPSSAIALVHELRARGPFTRMILGVTVIIDVVVILLFAVNSSLADALLAKLRFDPLMPLLVAAEIVCSIGLGYLLGRALPALGLARAGRGGRVVLVLAAGWSVFLLSVAVREWTQRFQHEIFLEPLLICMVAGFTVTNYTEHRIAFRRTLDLASPPVYVAFFTLAGAALALDLVVQAWRVTLLLFAVRAVGIFLGSFLGGVAAGDPMRLNRLAWMTFMTQAGIGLGLAKQVAVEFPGWGESFSTVIISVIVLNQVVGPPLFKLAIHRAGEARLGAGKRDLKGTPTVFIFGLDGQALALARQLEAHGWRVKVATRKESIVEQPPGNIEIVRLPALSHQALKEADAGEAQAFVGLMGDRDNLRLCKLAHEHFGVPNLVVQSADRDRWQLYHDLGARIIDPGVALVSLLDHYVRSPTATSMLLGLDHNQDAVDLRVHNPELDGMALRDLDLPLDTLILTVSRNGATLISHGHTRLEVGDVVTVVGSPTSLDDVARRFDA